MQGTIEEHICINNYWFSSILGRPMYEEFGPGFAALNWRHGYTQNFMSAIGFLMNEPDYNFVLIMCW